ncbi:cell division protein ZapE [Cohnella sp. CFH 77786]|uniref:AFG1/ZapE family ATPase n=1 Tax=Cohnella sp. CFH 77786 TaxID=2662265 RepID=UPI001C60F83F|nr:AFG1/ZapE family ATPase [Cohnella sp. CFH 77786]MBW5445845.1 cell division protein ZapE [Cohnella sp. CFH 77786]
MQSIKEALEGNESLQARLAEVMNRYTPDYFRERLPELAELGATDDQIRKASAQLLDRVRQAEQCQGCTDYAACRRPAGQEGMQIHLDIQSEHITSLHSMCEPFRAHHRELRWQRLLSLSGKAASDKDFTFDNFPDAQKRRHKQLCAYIHRFAQEFAPGASDKGVYIYGPPGTAKTHLVLSMVNRLEERRVPVLFIRTDAIFRNMRGMLSKKESLDTLIEAYCTTPVLVIDEFGQEAGTEFTVDVMFEIVNARFTGNLPTFATSNYAPDQVYEKAMRKHRLEEKVEAIRSRLNQMMKHAHMDGEDGRKKDRETF